MALDGARLSVTVRSVNSASQAPASKEVITSMEMNTAFGEGGHER